MDTKKTGAFIAALRKQKGLTQQALAEQLFVTDKTVSRWETGCYSPPTDILAPLSEILGTTADEIILGSIAGERRTEQACEISENSAVEQSSFSLKEKTEFYKKKWLREHILSCVLLAAGLVIIIAAALLNHLYWAAWIAYLAALITAVIIRNNMMAYIERNAYDVSGNTTNLKRSN